MKTSQLLFCIIATLFIMSCDESDYGLENGKLSGWYTNLADIAQADDFQRINQAIYSNECIYTTGYSHNYDKYATRDLFFYSNGCWSSSAAHYGTCRFLPDPSFISAYRFINSNTVIYYNAWLWDPAYLPSSTEYVAETYAGPIFGTLVYHCESPYTYTYAKIDNKIILSNGDIFTITDSGLIKDGTGVVLTKYDPSNSF